MPVCTEPWFPRCHRTPVGAKIRRGCCAGDYGRLMVSTLARKPGFHDVIGHLKARGYTGKFFNQGRDTHTLSHLMVPSRMEAPSFRDIVWHLQLCEECPRILCLGKRQLQLPQQSGKRTYGYKYKLIFEPSFAGEKGGAQEIHHGGGSKERTATAEQGGKWEGRGWLERRAPRATRQHNGGGKTKGGKKAPAPKYPPYKRL
ncbi:hypothetical protein BJ912DRAFT_923553 [Pholiota molesta]|nr:hypothetical protein BJ912DRAFT_923553 [Pholiota molesta]